MHESIEEKAQRLVKEALGEFGWKEADLAKCPEKGWEESGNRIAIARVNGHYNGVDYQPPVAPERRGQASE